MKLTESEKINILSLYYGLKKTLSEQTQTERWRSASCAGKKRSCNVKVLQVQMKINDTCGLKTKLAEDGIWGPITDPSFAKCKAIKGGVSQPNAEVPTAETPLATQSTTAEKSNQEVQNTNIVGPVLPPDQSVPPTTTANSTVQPITTPEQAQVAIDQANQQAENIRQTQKATKEMCRIVSKAINPGFLSFRKPVSNPELCQALFKCVNDGIIQADATKYQACNATPTNNPQQPS